jgi:DNA primase
MEIPDIKRQLAILAVLSHYGLRPDRNYRLRCPFHPDKNPSMQIYPKTGTFSCFSTNCRAGSGDQIQFIELMEKCTRHEALVRAAELAGQYGSVASEITPDPKPAIAEGDLLAKEAVLARLFAYFKKALPLTARAVDYLKTRSLDYHSQEVGYNGGDWHQQLREKHFIKSSERYGLLKASAVKGYKAWGRDSVIFPLKDKQNRIISLYGRSITNDSDQRHFYLSGREGLYPGYPRPDTTRLILTESVIDAASLMQQQLIREQYGVLALYGANGLTEEHIAAIRDLSSLQQILFMLDGDEAGRVATAKHAATLQQLLPSVNISWVPLPENEDVNSVLESHDNPEVLAALISREVDFSFSTENSPAAPAPVPGAGERPAAPASAADQPRLDSRNPQLLIYDEGDLYIEVLGGIRITGLERMKVTLKATAKNSPSLPLWHSLDLYHHAQRQQTLASLTESFDLPLATVEATLARLTSALEAYRLERIESLQPKARDIPPMSEQARQLALSELKHPHLVERTGELIGLSGIVGEQTNRLIAYLVYSTRKQHTPLHVMLLGSSGSGKTWLQERVSALIPEQDKIQITQITGNALYYFGREELSGKLILIEDMDGAGDVLYPLRELQTKRRISKTVTLKDTRGNLRTVTLVVEGPVSVSGCTTKEKLYEDNANRCILLYTDQGPDQDARINRYQGQVAAGAIDQQRQERYRELFCNMQRLLAPIRVINPYAGDIQLPASVFRPRRTMTLLLGFIEAITFYHQYQREVKYLGTEPYIETTVQDIGSAFGLLRDVLFARSDELGRPTREFLEGLKIHLHHNKQESFTPPDIRKAFRLEPRTLQRYLRSLRQYGLIRAVGVYHPRRGPEYRLGDEGEYRRLTSQIDAHLEGILEKLKSSSTPTATVERQWGGVAVKGSPNKGFTHSDTSDTQKDY